MKCQFCKWDFKEGFIQLHHIHPKFMDNKRGDGMQLNLCEKCHNILHLTIPALYWNILTPEQKNKAIKIVVEYSKKRGNINDS